MYGGGGDRFQGGFESNDEDYLDHSEYDYEDEMPVRSDGSLVKYRTFSEFMYPNIEVGGTYAFVVNRSNTTV